MRLIERVIFIIGLCFFCLALKAQTAVDCFDSTHFATKGKKIELNKDCWIVIGTEYNRCQDERTMLDTLFRASEEEVAIWKEKYQKEHATRLSTKANLDSTRNVFYKTNEYFIKQQQYSTQLENVLAIARRNHVLYATGGSVATILTYILIKAIK